MSAILLRKLNMPTKWTVHSALINDASVTVDVRDQLERYYLLYWTPDHFFDQMNNGIIAHQGIEYLVIYKNCNPISLRRCEQISLSFRKAKSEYELCAYVIVQKT
jgi:hypothetical protein